MNKEALEGYIAEAATADEPMYFIYDHPERGLERRALVLDPEIPLRETAGGEILLVGHDPLRSAPRNFRIDRIEEVFA